MKVKRRLMAALGSLKEQASGAATVLSTIETAILRSTEHALTAPDDKYVHSILFEISNAPGAITYLARRITARLASNQNAVVALKTLLLLHRLLRGGDRYFEQDLHGLWVSGDLRINLKWMAGDPDPLCSFALCYSRFLGERMDWIINQAGNLEPNRTLLVSGSSSQRSFQEEKAEFVLYRLSKCQTFFDKIMDCLPTACCSNNSSMSSCATTIHRLAMGILLRESFRVYGSFCGDMDIVSSSFLESDKPPRALAVDIFRKACSQTSGLRDYYDSCKKFMEGKSFDYPVVRVFTATDFSWTESSPSLPSSREEEAAVAADGVDDESASSKRPFSGGMETRISTVWVDFDEGEDAQSSSFSFEGFEGCFAAAAAAGVAERGTSVEGKGVELL